MQNLVKITTIVLLLVTLSALAAETPEAGAKLNRFQVEKTVLRDDPPNFGMNFGTSPFRPWSSDMYFNCWNDWYCMEPITFRINGQATGGGSVDGTDYLEAKKGESCSQSTPGARSNGAGYWNTMENGFWNGATITIWRETKDSIECIRTARVKEFRSPKRGEQGEERFYLEGDGEIPQKGDIYMVHMTGLEVPDAVPLPQQRRYSDFVKPSPGSGVTWILDDTTFAPEGCSTASLKMTLPGSYKPVGMEHQYLRWGGKELHYRDGKKYRCDIWLRQEGLTAPVTVQLGDRITKELTPDDEWEKFSFEVPNDKPIGPGIYQLIVGSKGKGTLWVDNFVVYEEGVEPFAIMPQWLDALKEYKPGVLRDMGGLGLKSLEGWLSHGFARKQVYDVDKGVWTAWAQGNISLPQLLELCEATGAKPYIMTYVLMTDEEIDQLTEYLCAPADKGYGKVRAAHGHPKPWSETFETIYIECANEMWNSLFMPQAYPRQPELAGKVASRLYKKIKENPYNTIQNIRGICPAWVVALRPGGWTPKALINCPEAEVIASAPSGYIGGWDGATIIGENDDELLEANLLYSAQHFEPRMKDFTELWQNIGRELEMLIYEVGPGYALPTPDEPVLEEEERIQKTLALGTVTLDNFMFMLANNANGNYFKMKKDPKWATHNQDMAPHNTTLALMLRNIYCTGDLMHVTDIAVNTVDIPERQSIGLDNKGARRQQIMPAMNGVPLVRLYAFKDGKKHSFLALNRSYKDTQTIQLDVPYAPDTAYTVYMLSADDPRATNRSEEELRIVESKESGFSKEFTFELPPASCCVIVNYEK